MTCWRLINRATHKSRIEKCNVATLANQIKLYESFDINSNQINFLYFSQNSSAVLCQHLAAELFVLDQIVNRLISINDRDESIKLDKQLSKTLKNLRNACALGASVQCAIISTEQYRQNGNELHNLTTWNSLRTILQTETDDPTNNSHSGLLSISPSTRKMCWQFIANLIVQNETTQRSIWQEFIGFFLTYLSSQSTANARECTMIVYNIFRSGLADDSAQNIFVTLLHCLSRLHGNDDNDFLHIFMEHLLTTHNCVVRSYAKCNGDERITVLYYIADYIRNSDSTQATVNTLLLKHICKEFKIKSDCVLKTLSTYVDRIEPKEVIALMDVIAQASSNERYSHIMADDASLFLNVGFLLKSIHQIGKLGGEVSNIFTPVQKLEHVAPNSMQEDASIERDISYQLKSMLVRIVGNLAYKNRKNQDLVSAQIGYRRSEYF